MAATVSDLLSAWNAKAELRYLADQAFKIVH